MSNAFISAKRSKLSLSSLFGCKDTNKRAKYQTCLSISQRVKSILMVAVKIRILYISANDFVRFLFEGRSARAKVRSARGESIPYSP